MVKRLGHPVVVDKVKHSPQVRTTYPSTGPEPVLWNSLHRRLRWKNLLKGYLYFKFGQLSDFNRYDLVGAQQDFLTLHDVL